jgi:TRAP-type C4-dicarboxylate transport system permease small subunit
LIAACSRLMSLIERVLRTIAAACLLAVMLIIFCDVFARYVFNAPIGWTYELVGMYLMPALFYLAVSDTLADDHHIAVDLLSARIPTPARRLVEILAGAATAGIFAWIAWIFGNSALADYRSGAVVMGTVEWPTWVPETIVVVGAVSIGLRLSGRVVGHVASLATGRPLIGLPRPPQD